MYYPVSTPGRWTWRYWRGPYCILLQVYGKDFFTGIADCIPAKAAPREGAVAAMGLSQTVDLALGDSPAANLQN